MYYNIKLYNLPTTIRGLTIYNSDGGYTVFINCRLSSEMQQETLLHELRHIEQHDFEKFNADKIECDIRR